MIENMQKVLFIGPENHKEDVLLRLQKLGITQIEQYRGSIYSRDDVDVDNSRADKIMSVYKSLLKYEKRMKDEEISVEPVKETAGKIVEQMTELEKELSRLKDQHLILNNKREALLPWGRFRLSLIEELQEKGNIHIQFFEVAHKIAHEVTIEDVIADILISADTQRKYFITFADKALKIENCLEIHFDEDLTTIEAAIALNNKRQKEIINIIYSYVQAKKKIYRLYLTELNKVNFFKASASAASEIEGVLFAVQGWCPEKDYKKLEEGLKDVMVTVQKIEPEPDERIPTKMNNSNISELGEDLVKVYDTPGYQDWDPSAWLFICFTVFFAMIMADGGYGLLLLLLLGFIRFKIKNPKPAIKRFFKLSMALSGATFIYGLLSGSFFGLSMENPIFGWLVKLRLFNANDTDAMMHAAIVIGMVHISLSVVLKTLRQLISLKEYIPTIANVAWIVNIWAFYFWYGNKDAAGQEAIAVTAQNILLGGMGLVFIIGAIMAKTFNPIFIVFKGIMAVYDGVQFFSDILSYIRIFALGLSGALIAQTFNDMALTIWNMDNIGGYIGAVVVFLLGHTLNIILCIMGGVIHGLRLNFLEWYRWNFDGNGKLFKPFRDLLT